VTHDVSYDIRVGDDLDERFRITGLIQRSGMSTIYKAIDCSSGRFVALKIPHMELECDAGYFSRFEREEEIGKRLNHPGVLKIIPVEDKSRPYIAMEYLEGRTLDRILDETRPFPLSKAIEIAGRVCETLDYMHQHDVVHRDLKPGNIMVCDDGSLRVIDFGIAKTLAMRRVTFGGFSPKMGTPDYMAPEQIKGKRGDVRTDIYSLGVILYEMTTGSLPFNGENTYELMNARLIRNPRPPRDINPELTPEIEEIILHALEREPSDRYSSAAAMKAELDSPETVQVTGRCKRPNSPSNWTQTAKQIGFVLLIAVTPVVFFLLFLLMFQHQSLNR
jgi:serine/threonine protein kinase